MTTSETREFYLVQKCWFEGPNVQPPMDYLALFESRRQADELAMHSAHHYGSQQQAVVRTILLNNGLGYAFASAGKLFWVRTVQVDVTSHQLYGVGTKFAHAIFTGHVIGGTGNVNSRRGTEAKTGVVFVGPDSHTQALQSLGAVGINNCKAANCRIACIPFAPLENLMDGWLTTTGSTETSGTPSGHHLAALADSHKRSARQACNFVVCNEPLAECGDLRPLKRQCGPFSHHVEQQQHQHPVDAAMQLS